jgi:hypothetical protein
MALGLGVLLGIGGLAAEGQEIRQTPMQPRAPWLTGARSLGDLAPRVLTFKPDAQTAAFLAGAVGGPPRHVLEPVTIAPFGQATLLSSTFRERISAAVASVPPRIWQRLGERGYRFQAARLVTDAAPRLRYDQPRGWPAGLTWENTDAVHVPQWRVLVVSELRRNKQGTLVPAVRVERVVRHEVGHAFDAILGGQLDFYSSSPEFTVAFERDLRQIAAADRERLAYYLQTADNAGRQEAFAEAFAEILGGGSSPERAELFRQAFPNVFAQVEQSLAAWRD